MDREEHTRRDEIAEVIGRITDWHGVLSATNYEIVDVLAAGGYLLPAPAPDAVDRVQLLLRINESLRATQIPAGMTAEKLREIAAWIGGEDSRGRGAVLAADLRAWASALDTSSESPKEET